VAHGPATIAGVTADRYTLCIQREDSEKLVLDGLGLARAFFRAETGPAIPGYDPVAGLGDPARVVLDDIVAMNSTMRSRSKHSLWDDVLAGDQQWLRDIPPDLEMVAADDAHWAALDGDALVATAIDACIRPGIGLAGATKLLHLKRPRVMPILDQLVAEMMGVTLPSSSAAEARAALARRLATAIRRESRRNVTPLHRIQADLEKRDVMRPLIRIFDAILRSSHPAASVTGATRSIAVRLRT
jgi:hypothetical protein